MRGVLGVIMAIHGIAHLVGFLVPWRLIKTSEEPATTILAGRVHMGDAGMRVFGIIWLGLAIGFVIAGIGAWTGSRWWIRFATGVALPSLLFCVLALPQSKIGIPVNLAILALILAGSRFGWF